MRVSTTYLHNQGVKNILDQQAKLVDIQDKISRGVKITAPSDDPGAFSRIMSLDEVIAQMTQHEENANYATQRLNLEEATLDGSVNAIQRVRELTIQAANTGTYSLAEHKIIAAELREKLNELMDYANTQDASGEYLFSGFQSGVRPFTTDGLGNYFYNGDQGQLALQIGTNRQVVANDTGAEIFQLIRNGNGTFSTRANDTNGGTAKISPGSLAVPSLYQKHDFSIEFSEVLPAVVPAEYTYDVIDDTTGVTVLTAQPYIPGNVIAFNGVQVEITGEPADGDIFNVETSRNEDIFTTIHNLITTLESPVVGNVRGSIGGDFINNGFDFAGGAGDIVTFDIQFDGQTLNLSHTVTGVDTNASIASALLTDPVNGIAAGNGIVIPGSLVDNLDGTYTLTGNTGMTATFRLDATGTNIEFISTGGTIDAPVDLVITNLVDGNQSLTGNDATLGLTTTANTVASPAQVTIGGSAGFYPGGLTNAQLSQNIDTALNNLDRAMSGIIDVQTSIGGRLNAIDSQLETNAAKKEYMQKVRSDIEDLDLAEAISDMTFQSSALQIAQQTFASIQKLTLFNFI